MCKGPLTLLTLLVQPLVLCVSDKFVIDASSTSVFDVKPSKP